MDLICNRKELKINNHEANSPFFGIKKIAFNYENQKITNIDESIVNRFREYVKCHPLHLRLL